MGCRPSCIGARIPSIFVSPFRKFREKCLVFCIAVVQGYDGKSVFVGTILQPCNQIIVIIGNGGFISAGEKNIDIVRNICSNAGTSAFIIG